MLNRSMDLTRRSISLGFEITRDILEEAKRKSDAHGIQFCILFIPSKERVFFDYLIEKGYQLPADYYQLVDRENSLVDSLSSLAERLSINYVDAKPFVLQALHKSREVYPFMDNGHPLAIGYEAYAKAAYSILDAHENPEE